MSVSKNVKKMTVPTIMDMKSKGEKITMLTAYDALMAQILDDSGIDIILVGDSGGMVMGGHENTLAVTMDEMIHYTRSVRRGVSKALLIADMPFLSYQADMGEAIRNAGRFLQEAGAEGVKIEGGKAVAGLVQKLVDYGIPVMGHIGLTPQSIHQFGGYGLRGNNRKMAEELIEDAKILQDAGAFCIVLEKIPAELAEKISETLKIPTIGIGAGVNCDGQVLVSQDMLGMYTKFKPKFVRRYAELGELMTTAFKNYITEVKNNRFPDTDESY
ncbi:MAG: 3-methyl-2-oxobutanoate hydroxymethyltransferase [Calditrichaceae bacterium]